MILKGYIFSRPFLEERVPQHVQNIVIQNYCKNRDYTFQLSATEYRYKESTFILMELLEDISKYDGLVFYSLFQLPINEEKRHFLYNKILKKNKVIHFAVEELKMKNDNDKNHIEEIFKLKLSEFDTKKFKKIGKVKNFVTFKHKKVKRNYLERMSNNKILCMNTSKKYGYDYWDGNRKFGYGGYRYIEGYQTYLAQKLIKEYKLDKNSKILDIGGGKGFLAYELQRILKNKNIFCCDISKYAIKKSKKELFNKVFFHDIKKKFNFSDNHFDLVLCINVLHNLKLENLENALKEIERLSKNKFICVESYKNNKQQFNLQCWALTAETLIDSQSWKWIFKKSGYSGDFEFIYFD